MSIHPVWQATLSVRLRFMAFLFQAVFLFFIPTLVLAQKTDAEVSGDEGVLAYDQKRYSDACYPAEAKAFKTCFDLN